MEVINCDKLRLNIAAVVTPSTKDERGKSMTNRHRDGRHKIRAATGEFIQDQLQITDDINREDPLNVIETVPITLGNMLAAAAEEKELSKGTMSNLLASGHIVDPIAHIYDFEVAPSIQSITSQVSEENDGYEADPCMDVDTETRYPESREVYLGVMGLLKRPGPAVEPKSGETGEHEIAEWYFKRQRAYRPQWGQLGSQ